MIMANNPSQQVKTNGTAEPKEHPKSCGFCGGGILDVAFLVSSPVTNNTICGNCATIIVQQTMAHQAKTAVILRAASREYPEIFHQNPETGELSIVSKSGLDDAINKQSGN